VKSSDSVKRLLLSAAVIIAGGLVSVGLTAPTPAAAASGPELKVSVVVTPPKATYAVGDAITTTFVVTNTGAAIATNVRLLGGDEDGVDRATPPPADKFDLAPGGSHSIPWAGTINQAAAIAGFASGGWSFTDDEGQAPPNDVIGGYSIPVPGMTGTLNGKIFIDVKGNFDPTQPGLAGVTVTATQQGGPVVASATTDQNGQFSMLNLAAGVYEVRVLGWKIKDADTSGGTSAQVKGGQISEVEVGIVPGSGTSAPTPTASRTATPPSSTATGTGPASASGSSRAVSLPVTGAPTGLMAAIGGGLVLVGVVAVLVSRRRRIGASRTE
jgi:LPXTG-motif cell wall-anchored protein